MRISDWSSDVCSSDLVRDESDRKDSVRVVIDVRRDVDPAIVLNKLRRHTQLVTSFGMNAVCLDSRSEEHTSELQSLMRISYAVFCLKKKKKHTYINTYHITMLTTEQHTPL